MIKNDNQLFYTCSLIEYIGRLKKRRRSDIVQQLGKIAIHRIYNHADILCCEPIDNVAKEYIFMCHIEEGNYDNVLQCKYDIPDYWIIGEVYERLIEDIYVDNVINVLITVYNSWISEAISNYNSDFYCQSREYLYQCYLAGEVLE